MNAHPGPPSVVAALLLASGLAGAQEIGKLQLAPEPSDLLAGRLTVRVPPGAGTSPRRAGVMSAPTGAEDETRILIDAETERLVLLANELFCTAGPDFDGVVSRATEGWTAPGEAGYTLEPPLEGPGGARRFLYLPPKVEVEDDAALVLGAYVVQPDRTVQQLTFYANTAAARDPTGCATLARRIAATVAPGPRRLEVSEGERHVRISDTHELVFRAPEGFVATLRPGPDFDLFNIHRVGSFGSPTYRMGIYSGRGPRYHHDRREEPRPAVRLVPGRLLGRPVEWHVWTETAEGGRADRTFVEAIARQEETDHPWCWHVWFFPNDAQEEARLKALAESLEDRVVTTKPATRPGEAR
ncbi:MAG TPA: hypothetical protein VKF62_03300 [Planctomycetota bacterium]|nr:hypothetical protein [Planctomycetota bacterium]